jgi:hypothetical protein
MRQERKVLTQMSIKMFCLTVVRRAICAKAVAASVVVSDMLRGRGVGGTGR